MGEKRDLPAVVQLVLLVKSKGRGEQGDDLLEELLFVVWAVHVSNGDGWGAEMG